MICAALSMVACNNNRKSYTEHLKDEERAIDRLITTNGFEILKNFPQDTVFQTNQFVKLSNDVYLNIIDRGSSERAVSGSTKILYRCIVSYPMDSAYVSSSLYSAYVHSSGEYAGKSVNYGPRAAGTRPYSITYMDPDNYYSTGSNMYGSEGIMSALKYVGDKGKVKLIVPFKRGLSTDNSSGVYEPAYYEIIQFTFEDNL